MSTGSSFSLAATKTWVYQRNTSICGGGSKALRYEIIPLEPLIFLNHEPYRAGYARFNQGYVGHPSSHSPTSTTFIHGQRLEDALKDNQKLPHILQFCHVIKKVAAALQGRKVRIASCATRSSEKSDWGKMKGVARNDKMMHVREEDRVEGGGSAVL
jgi:hypothetical protein